MNLEEYQLECKRTCPDLGSYDKNIFHMQLGVNTEIGEFLDIVKKHIAYNKELDKVHLQEEISDIMWYVANQATFEGVVLQNLEDFIFNLDLEKSKNTPIESSSYIMMNLATYYNETITTDSSNFYDEIINILILASRALELDFYKGLENNIAKLKVRYPDKFTSEAALNRNLDAERKELEK